MREATDWRGRLSRSYKSSAAGSAIRAPSADLSGCFFPPCKVPVLSSRVSISE
ncbi:unnamed protein product, partial [Iphiclides podalirius]